MRKDPRKLLFGASRRKEDGTVVAKITNESVIPADGYTVHLVPVRKLISKEV